MEDNLVTTTKPAIKVESIKDFVKAKGFDRISTRVRVNINGYPYLIFTNTSKPKSEQSENIYFSKNSAENVTEDQPVTRELLSTLSIGYTKNEAGEDRVKLVSGSIDINSLLD